MEPVPNITAKNSATGKHIAARKNSDSDKYGGWTFSPKDFNDFAMKAINEKKIPTSMMLGGIHELPMDIAGGYDQSFWAAEWLVREFVNTEYVDSRWDFWVSFDGEPKNVGTEDDPDGLVY